MTSRHPRDLGRVFNEVPELYDRVRPAYPEQLFADLVAVTGMGGRSSVLEVGCGTGQATRSLAALAGAVTAIEPGVDMAALARRRLSTFGNVGVEVSTFEDWDDRGRRFDVLVAASAWHWVGPSIGWRRAHHVLRPAGVRAGWSDIDGVLTKTATVHAVAWKQMFDDFLRARDGTDFCPFDLDHDYHQYVDGKPRHDGARDFLASRRVPSADGSPSGEPSRTTNFGLGNHKDVLLHAIINKQGVEAYDGSVRYLEATRAARPGPDRGVVQCQYERGPRCDRFVRPG
jgi:SAM-dependent methyltransferase